MEDAIYIGKEEIRALLINIINLAILFYCLLLLITLLLLPYINSILHYYSLIHSDEGLALETSFFESFMVANLPLSTEWLIIYFSVSLSHRRSTQLLSKLNSLSSVRTGLSYVPYAIFGTVFVNTDRERP